MKSLFGKYWALALAGVIVQSVVNIAALVRMLGFTVPVAEQYISFIIEWAADLSAAAAALVVLAAFMTVRESRRNRALGRVRDWATETVLKLTRPSHEPSVAKRLADWQERLRTIEAESSRASASARLIGGGLETKVNKAVKTFLEFEEYFGNHAEPEAVKTSLKTTVIAFKEVINSTCDSPYRSQ